MPYSRAQGEGGFARFCVPHVYLHFLSPRHPLTTLDHLFLAHSRSIFFSFLISFTVCHFRVTIFSAVATIAESGSQVERNMEEE